MESFDFDEDFDWTTFVIVNYVETFLVSPMMVLETLVQVQFQPKPESNADQESAIGRLQGDLPEQVKQVVESEGIAGLAKGCHLTFFAFKGLYALIQPWIEEGINDFLDVLDDVNPFTNVISHTIAGSLLSPLELVRTRLVVQSTGKDRRYYGPFHCFMAIAQDEKPFASAGFLSTFYNPRILTPSLLMYSLTPLLRRCTIHVLEEELGLDHHFTPALYHLGMMVGIGFESLVLTPLDLVRKRLFVQRIDAFSRQTIQEKKPHVAFPTAIETSPAPYTGVLNAVWAIMSEEGGKTAKKTKIQTQEWENVYGGGSQKKAQFGQGFFSLFRGFWPRYCQSLVEYLSKEINQDFDW
ncbi:mitochondrial carrier domain-containing protein [Gorgonomyces haynaldii]|nr:mitochondrial carrier domain-containing protein [Gorgonomyces haynaldii]